MKSKRVLSVFLAMIMIMIFSACHSEGNQEVLSNPTQSETPIVISDDGAWIGKGGCYKLERVKDGDFYLVKGSPEHLIYDTAFQLLNNDGSVLLDEYYRDYFVTEDGVWYLQEKGLVGEEYITDCYVVKIDYNGQELARIDLGAVADSLAVIDDTLYIYSALKQTLIIYGTDGTNLGQVDISSAPTEEFSARLYTGGDDSVWLLNNIDSGMSIYPVNLESMKLGTPCELPKDLQTLRTGTEQHPFLMATSNELCYFEPTSGSMTNILYWDECCINGNELRSFMPDDDGFLCISVTGLVRISPAEAEEVHFRTRLTLGTVSKYEGSSLAAQFNAISDEYYVDVIDYSSNGSLSREDALIKLNTELMSGNGPDMIIPTDFTSLHSDSVFVDLYPMIDEDTELKREDFYGLGTLESGDQLLIAPSNVAVSTFGAKPEVAKGRIGWTWDEYFDLESKLPTGGVMYSYLGADFFLQSSLELYLPHAIDWENGTCSFDTPEFIRILEAAKAGYDPNCPEENPYYADEVNAMMDDGRMILEEFYFVDTESFVQNENLCGKLEYIGWPTPDGSCGSVFHVSGVSVSAGSNNQDGCREFVKFILKGSYMYKPTFEQAIADASMPKDGDDTQNNVLTKEGAERYRKLMEGITVAVSDNSEISKIVLEEAAPMFTGDKTPEETAKIIQSVMSIYVAEHK